MTNSIRTPRQGVTASSRRIAEAVDNEEWQKIRVGMKGTSTEDKLDTLQFYFNSNAHEVCDCDAIWVGERGDETCLVHCDVCIRVDNYIKALCRGGQLYAGESLRTALEQNWKLRIKK